MKNCQIRSFNFLSPIIVKNRHPGEPPTLITTIYNRSNIVMFVDVHDWLENKNRPISISDHIITKRKKHKLIVSIRYSLIL